jgi:hypothetical protein
MSAPTRFLALAVFSWIGIRATAGMVDLAPLPALATVPPVTPLTALPVAEAQPAMSMTPPPGGAPLPAGYGYAYGYGQLSAAYPAYGGYAYSPAYAGPMPGPSPRYPAALYYPYPVQSAAAPQSTPAAPLSLAELDFGGFGQAEETPLSQLALAAPTRRQSVPPTFSDKPRSGFDRLSLSSWAFIRQEQPQLVDLRGPAVPVGEAPLASGGTLGGSQAGARLTWRPTQALAVNLRVSAPLRQGQTKMAGEAALGVAWQPLQSVPVRLMAERRKAIGAPGGGRDAFALLGEGGIYGRALPWQFRLDGYGQAGVVGLRTRDWFVDGGVTATRPLFGRFALGAGAWGGAQPGLSRLDIGPRLSMQVRPGIRTHLDYRHRLFGRSEPGSGFAATVTTDF